MARQVLITGGAGFIGSHLADALLDRGDRVRALDIVPKHVHGPNAHHPAHLNEDVELVVGDVRDPAMVRRALSGVDAVFHFASRVGVEQSMYEISAYTDVNEVGTAVLAEALVQRPVERLVLASSMSVYGEGLYRTADGMLVENAERAVDGLRDGLWDPRGEDGERLVPLPTPEWKRPSLESVYALSKCQQEGLCMILNRAYNVPAVVLRFFNVYGARQALSNPYTGVLASFAARLLNGRRPILFEDGEQSRDFVNVRDVVRACTLALDEPLAPGNVLNVGSGDSHSVCDVAARLAAAVGGPELTPIVSGKCRAGDVRHCYADISRAREVLGYTPRVSLDDGLRDLAEWLCSQVAEDRVEQPNEALAARELSV